MLPGGWKTAFEVSTTVLMLTAAGFLVWENWPSSRPERGGTPRLPTVAIPIDGAPVRGADSAKVAIVMYTDFECPFCAAAASGVLRELESVYVSSGRVKLVFKHFPLAIHESARSAAAAAICAGHDGKFWQMHDVLFANQKRLGDADLDNYAASLGLEAPRFRTCRNDKKTTAVVDADIAQGQGLKVTGTPTFYLGLVRPGGGLQPTNVLVGARPMTEFRKILEQLLASAG